MWFFHQHNAVSLRVALEELQDEGLSGDSKTSGVHIASDSTGTGTGTGIEAGETESPAERAFRLAFGQKTGRNQGLSTAAAVSYRTSSTDSSPGAAEQVLNLLQQNSKVVAHLWPSLHSCIECIAPQPDASSALSLTVYDPSIYDANHVLSYLARSYLIN
jgi:hypothetical protein